MGNFFSIIPPLKTKTKKNSLALPLQLEEAGGEAVSIARCAATCTTSCRATCTAFCAAIEFASRAVARFCAASCRFFLFFSIFRGSDLQAERCCRPVDSWRESGALALTVNESLGNTFLLNGRHSDS